MTVWTVGVGLTQHLKVENSFACVVHLLSSQSWTFSCAVVNEHHCIMFADKSLIEILMSVWLPSRKTLGCSGIPQGRTEYGI